MSTSISKISIPGEFRLFRLYEASDGGHYNLLSLHNFDFMIFKKKIFIVIFLVFSSVLRFPLISPILDILRVSGGGRGQ